MTEAYGNSAVCDAAAPLDERLHSQGRALDGVEIRIADAESDRAVDAGQIGEIQIRGNLMPGYLDDPERSAQAFSEDGYLRTGDLGVLDTCGRLQYKGRLKEMVKTGGINVAPAEIELILSESELVSLAFVTGVPDDDRDEILVALVVPEAGAAFDEAVLQAHCSQRLAAYKVPRRFLAIEGSELPLTSTGKLKRLELSRFALERLSA